MTVSEVQTSTGQGTAATEDNIPACACAVVRGITMVDPGAFNLECGLGTHSSFPVP